MSVEPKKAACRTCGLPIYWARTTDKKWMPIDATPAMHGNLVANLRGGVLRVEAFRVAEHAGRNRYLSHFSTCPQADQHRSKR